jgi:hypothetical protein
MPRRLGRPQEAAELVSHLACEANDSNLLRRAVDRFFRQSFTAPTGRNVISPRALALMSPLASHQTPKIRSTIARRFSAFMATL